MIDETYDIFLETLANRRRLKIINVIKNNSKNVSQIVRDTKLEQSSVSHNLKRLETCGFVTVRKNGKERIYSLNKKTIKPLMKLIENHVNQFCKNCVKKL